MCFILKLTQTWAIEAIPKLGEVIANRVSLDKMPRCLQWESTNVVSSKSVRIKDILEDPEVNIETIHCLNLAMPVIM